MDRARGVQSGEAGAGGKGARNLCPPTHIRLSEAKRRPVGVGANQGRDESACEGAVTDLALAILAPAPQLPIVTDSCKWGPMVVKGLSDIGFACV